MALNMSLVRRAGAAMVTVPGASYSLMMTLSGLFEI